MGSNNTLLMYFVLLCYVLICDATARIKVSEEELRWHKEYNLMKKPSLKTIKTKHGDIYDCVDFYKQPAFDHPLLKDHAFYPEMKPSSVPDKVTNDVKPSSKKAIKLDDIMLPDGGCPTGTVPIRRLSKDEYIKTRRFTEQYASRAKDNALQSRPGTHFAIDQSKSEAGTIYNGVYGQLSIHNPSVNPSQYSSAEFILQNENDSIQVGWTVNPALYKDNHTRFFQYLNAGESHCFNNHCPGFISVREDIPIDFAFHRMSTYGKESYVIPIFIYQDAKSGNWWLQVSLNDTVIGFWPQHIFSGLANSASYIAVGGEAYGPPDQPLPPMGFARWPEQDTLRTAYCSSFSVVDENHNLIVNQHTKEYTDIKNYGVYDVGYDEGIGRLVIYGGPY